MNEESNMDNSAEFLVRKLLTESFHSLEYMSSVELPDDSMIIYRNGTPGHFVLAFVTGSDEDLPTFGPYLIKTQLENTRSLLTTGALDLMQDGGVPDISLAFVGTEVQVKAIEAEKYASTLDTFWQTVKTFSRPRPQ
jgi:hypothetical protein